MYLFVREREGEKTPVGGRAEKEWEKQTPGWAGGPMQGSILGLWDHDLSRRETLNQLSHPGVPTVKSP